MRHEMLKMVQTRATGKPSVKRAMRRLRVGKYGIAGFLGKHPGSVFTLCRYYNNLKDRITLDRTGLPQHSSLSCNLPLRTSKSAPLLIRDLQNHYRLEQKHHLASFHRPIYPSIQTYHFSSRGIKTPTRVLPPHPIPPPFPQHHPSTPNSFPRPYAYQSVLTPHTRTPTLRNKSQTPSLYARVTTICCVPGQCHLSMSLALIPTPYLHQFIPLPLASSTHESGQSSRVGGEMRLCHVSMYVCCVCLPSCLRTQHDASARLFSRPMAVTPAAALCSFARSWAGYASPASGACAVRAAAQHSLLDG